MRNLFITHILGAITLYVSSTCTATIVYVSPSGSHSSPFNTPGKAATNIQAAVNVATNAGDRVLILDGTNFLSTAVTISEAITVEGVNGPANVTINGSGLTHCFELEDVACTLSGLTITNGFTTGDGGGIRCDSLLPVITNCVIAGNSAANFGGGIMGGTTYHSFIRNNVAGNRGGGVHGAASPAKVYDSLIEFNVVTNEYGGGAGMSELYNCTVVGNSAPDAGGVDGSYLYNCVVYSNAAPLNADVAWSTIDASCIGSAGDETYGSYITSNPLFVDFSAQNYRLQPGSPCINAGDNGYVLNATDLDGNPRIVGMVDMGAYENQSGAGDSDEDGQSDVDEAIAGTDPNDDTSYFAVTNWSTGSFTIEWPAFPSRQYQVYRADSLTNIFSPVGPVILYPTNSYTDTENDGNPSGFYKVEVQLQ